MVEPDAIVKQARRLPVETRQTVADAILRSIYADMNRQDAHERFAGLCAIASSVLGTVYEADRRYRGASDVRTLCAKAMRLDGYSYEVIGSAMGRDHSTVLYYCHRADDMAAGFMGGYYANKYKEFFDKIEKLK